MHVQLLIGDFLFPVLDDERLPAAETLLARGRRRWHAPVPPEQWLCERFGVEKQGDWPVAPYALLGEGGEPRDAFWMRADPVHLRAEGDRLLLADASLFDLSRDEAEALVETLNRHFGERTTIYPLAPSRWYARFAAPPALATVSLTEARGAAVNERLPSGEAALAFHALMNEAQMLLHDHPVNRAREARGELPANALWFWGGGKLAPVAPARFAALVGDDPLARGLAAASGIPARRVPQNAGELLAQASAGGVVLAVLDALRGAASRSDAQALRAQRAAIERDWLAPLLEALARERIGMLTLHLPGRNTLVEVETARQDLRYFWRRRRPLSAYAEAKR